VKLVAGGENSPAVLGLVARLASTAGARVLAGRGTGPLATGPDTKSGAGDWVTDYDRGAERAVREYLASVRPGDALTGEEYPESGPGTSGYRWSIDPLDGTANFVRGIVYYATSVAVFGPGPDGEERWLAGAVTAPALGVQYWAAAGEGAHRRPWSATVPGEAGQDSDAGVAGDVRLTGPDPDSDSPVLATGFGYDAADRAVQLQAMATLLPHFVNVRRIGSAALDLCLVAEGALDAYAELGTHEWDWAAGALICEEAGVAVVRPARRGRWQSAGRVSLEGLPEFA